MGSADPIRRPTARARELRNDASPIERHLWRCLRSRQLGGYKFSRQMPVGPFICDFMCRERALVVELDGGEHTQKTEQDASRTLYIEGAGYRVLRFWNNEVMANTAGVLEEIARVLEQSPPPTPPVGGRGEG